MDPVTMFLIGQGINLASTIPQWLRGYQQEKRADELGKSLTRPVMGVPESQKQALSSAEAQSTMTRLPGQSGIEGRLDQTTANTLAMLERLSTGGPTMINAASRAYGNQMNAENELGVNAANMYLRNQDIYRNELGKTAEWENRAWQWNEMQPYLQKVNAIEALREGGIRNKYGAGQDLFGVLGNTATGLSFFDTDTSWMKDLFGGSGASQTAMQGVGKTAVDTTTSGNPSEIMNRWIAGPRRNILDRPMTPTSN